MWRLRDLLYSLAVIYNVDFNVSVTFFCPSGPSEFVIQFYFICEVVCACAFTLKFCVVLLWGNPTTVIQQ